MAVGINSGNQQIFKGKAGGYTLAGEIQFSPKLEQKLNVRLGVGSPLQKFWDNMLLKDMDRYTPMLYSRLKTSSKINLKFSVQS